MRKIEKLLIANRGEIAVRIARACKEMGVRSVALCHAADEGSPVLHEADETYEITGPTPVAAYLDVENVLEACAATGVDAVHPGYGFLSEKPELARALARAGVVFVGPSPEVMERMGDKVRARNFMISRGVPVVPSVTEDEAGDSFLDRVRELGVPLLIKPAAGGGGKGMRVVRALSELEGQLEQARSEGARYFGDGRVFCERLIERPRHIEVQILADEHGRCVHLWERECSVQRRFQKVIEESPCPAVSERTRAEVCKTAVEIARAAGYTNAGTVEFIMDSDGSFYFLEMNTRLQVEHPVTEMITGVDLVREQLRVAAGEPLGLEQEEIARVGHSIECRIYAEDAAHDFVPSVGRIRLLKVPSGPGLRCDLGVCEGQEVTTSFDPMLGKIIVHAGSRDQAISRMLRALREFVLLGVTTNLDFLQRVVDHPDFGGGKIHARYVDSRIEELRPAHDPEMIQAVLAAASLYSAQYRKAPALSGEPYASMGGWRN